METVNRPKLDMLFHDGRISRKYYKNSTCWRRTERTGDLRLANILNAMIQKWSRYTQLNKIIMSLAAT